jgi:hypothetical protein
MADPSTFELALQEAKKSLEEAYVERGAIEERIVSLKQAVDGLTALCDPEPEEVVRTSRGDITTAFKLSYAIRQVFSDSQEYKLTPTEVRDALLRMGVDLAKKYKQPLVPIHNTLKRMEAQGELVPVRDDNGDLRGYRWVSPLARAVAEVDSLRLKMRRVNAGASNRLEQYLRLHETLPEVATPPRAEQRTHPSDHLRPPGPADAEADRRLRKTLGSSQITPKK